MKILLIILGLLVMGALVVMEFQSCKTNSISASNNMDAVKSVKSNPPVVYHDFKSAMKSSMSPRRSIVAVELTEEQKLAKEKRLKEIKHVQATVFMKSEAKDTYEFQTIALELMNHGYGVEYAPYIYTKAIDTQAFMQNMKERKADERTIKFMYEEAKKRQINFLACGVGPFAPLDDPELIGKLLDLKPTMPHYQKTLNPEDTPEDQWLSDKDVLKYIQDHPAHPPKAVTAEASSAPVAAPAEAQ